MRVTRPMMIVLLALAGVHMAFAGNPAQDFPTATPAQVDLLNAAPAAQELVATSTLTRTPTPPGPVQLEAKDTANVRALPDQTSERLGEIRAGTQYNIIRQYFHWIEFQYDQSPNQRGWVFDELVNIIGDQASIQQVESLDATSASNFSFDTTATGLALTETPGGLLTATAIARTNPAPASTAQPGVVEVGTISSSGITEVATQRVALPTFTYPPGIVAFAPTQGTAEAIAPTDTAGGRPLISDSTGIAPIVPIVALAGLGLVGLVIGSIRR
jgi:hypothetical protein